MLSVTSNALSSRIMEYPLIMFCSYVVREEVEQHWKQKYDCRPVSAYIQWGKPYRILCNGTFQKSQEARSGLGLASSRCISLHNNRYGVINSATAFGRGSRLSSAPIPMINIAFREIGIRGSVSKVHMNLKVLPGCRKASKRPGRLFVYCCCCC